jgi:hypothetical protein
LVADRWILARLVELLELENVRVDVSGAPPAVDAG